MWPGVTARNCELLRRDFVQSLGSEITCVDFVYLIFNYILYYNKVNKCFIFFLFLIPNPSWVCTIIVRFSPILRTDHLHSLILTVLKINVYIYNFKKYIKHIRIPPFLNKLFSYKPNFCENLCLKRIPFHHISDSFITDRNGFEPIKGISTV